MESYWIESHIFNPKIDDFEDSSVLVIELYDKFKLYNCNNCEDNKENNNYDKKCFYCFSEFLKYEISEDKDIENIIFEIDDLKYFEFEVYKYMALGFEMKEIFHMSANNNLIIFFKKIGNRDKNIINDYINEKLHIFLNNNLIY
jgi:hypothetical protein